MTDTRLPPPGVARCPGPSAQDHIRRDISGAPAQLFDVSYDYLGSEDLPFDYYTSPEIAALEQELIFGATWQWACHVDHLPQVGSYYVYDIGRRSAILVRTNDGIRAYDNFCRHRGTQLKQPFSQGRSQQLRCPFHGWTWDLEGRIADIPCRWDFPHVTDESAALHDYRVEVWGGFVFINFDPNAPALNDYLGVLPQHFATWDLSDRFIEVHARKRLPCNWKAAMSAFLEAYHVLETHPEGIRTTGDANAQYDVYPPNVSRFWHTVGTKSPHVEREYTDQEMIELLMSRKNPDATDKPFVPEGSTARDVYAKYFIDVMSAQYGRNLSGLTTSEVIDSIQYFVFPNTFFFPGLQLSMVYRFRPDPTNPDFCTFDLLIMRPRPAEGAAPRPPAAFDLDVNDSYALTPGINPGLAHVYDQDTNNLAAQQRGFHGSVKGAETLGNYQEIRTRHLHTMVKRYISQTTQP